MKLKPHVLLAGSSTNPLLSVFVHQRAKKCPSITKISRGQDTISVCVPNLRPLYNFKVMYADKWRWLIFSYKVGQSDQIGIKLEFDVWQQSLDVYAKFQTDISKHVQKSPDKFSLAGSTSNTPFQVFLSARGPKNAHPWRKSVGIKTQYKYVYQIWGLYMIFKAINADKWLWPIFSCKVGQNVPIRMKLDLDV